MNSLQLRMVDYAEMVFRIADLVKKDFVLTKVAEQIIKSSSSVGANYSEAQSASSKKDFHNKIRIALKEARETEFWLILIYRRRKDLPHMQHALDESLALIKILSTISQKTKPQPPNS